MMAADILRRLVRADRFEADHKQTLENCVSKIYICFSEAAESISAWFLNDDPRTID